MDWEDKNIIMAFLKDSLKGQIKVDGLEKSILMAAISKDFIYQEISTQSPNSMMLSEIKFSEKFIKIYLSKIFD